MKKDIVFIVGAGRSGSTILDRTLGHHSKAFSLGEIINLNLDLSRGSLCGCGVILKECNFWNNIFKKIKTLERKNLLIDPNAFNVDFRKTIKSKNDFLKKIRRIKNGFFLKVGINPKFLIDENVLKNQKFLYDLVFKETGASVLIDSSKSINRALYLSKYLKGYNSIFIHLVRDGRAVLNSTQKEYYTVKFPAEGRGFIAKQFPSSPKKPELMINNWVNLNKRILFLKKLYNLKNYLFIRFEDFTNDPKKQLTPILNKINLEWEDKILEFKYGDNHMVCGNPSRLNAMKLKPATRDWENKLDNNLLITFNKMAGELNRKFGYT